MSHAKKQKNTSHNEEKNQAIETDPDLTQMLELPENIKTVIIIVFLMFKKVK